MNNKIALAVITAFLALVGCGGGGSTTSPVTPPATSAPPAPVPPAPVPIIQPASVQAAVAPMYGASATQTGAFNAFAAFRAAAGLGPVNQSTAIDTAAMNHANYIRLNNSGTTPHVEVVGNQGFTGASVQDRLISAGYGATSASEVIGWSGPAGSSDAVDALAATVYHRAPLLMEHWTGLGIATSNDGFVVIDLGARAAFTQRVAGNFVGVYPADNQSGVALNHAPESPSPFADTNGTAASFCTKSYPMSVMTQGSTKLSVTSFTVTEEGAAAPLQATVVTKESDANGLITQNMVFLVANSAFKPNTTYLVRFIGSAAGSATGAANGVMPIDKTWRFVTRTSKASYCS